jgi:hypothetical protein
MSERIPRRAALTRLAGLCAASFLAPGRFDPWVEGHGHHGRHAELVHPAPRPGITAEKVLPDDKLPDRKRVRDAFTSARAYPELFDGVCCACGCEKEHRSLLACFESAQPTGCWGCQEEAALIASMAKDGKTLDEIRAAIDKKWG